MATNNSKTRGMGNAPRAAGRKKSWIQEDDEALIGMWLERVPLAEMARKLGRSVSALQTRATRLNLPLRKSPDDFPKGKMRPCLNCKGVFFSRSFGNRFCDPCKRNWPSGVADESSSTSNL